MIAAGHRKFLGTPAVLKTQDYISVSLIWVVGVREGREIGQWVICLP